MQLLEIQAPGGILILLYITWHHLHRAHHILPAWLECLVPVDTDPTCFNFPALRDSGCLNIYRCVAVILQSAPVATQ